MEQAVLTVRDSAAPHIAARAALSMADRTPPRRAGRPPMSETVIPDATDLAAMMRRLAEDEDRAAFAALFEYFAPRIKAYMMRSGSDDVAAEEFAQEAMLMVWRRASSFDPSQASVATWVFTIARNKRIDAFRRNNRPELDPDDPLLQPAAEPMQDDKMEEDQVAEAIRTAMAGLPAEQVRMLQMAFYEDKAHSEIAEETGLPLGTVKSRLRLAMGKMKNLLGETDL